MGRSIQPLTSLVARATTYQTTALQALSRLMDGNSGSETIHRLRVCMRRLQVFGDLVGDRQSASRLGETVSCLSSLRTLHVFGQHLKHAGAAQSDLTRVRRLEDEILEELDERRTYRKIERIVWKFGSPDVPGDLQWLIDRMKVLRHLHAANLQELIAALRVKPKRKKLHALRLAIKTIRYQEEWAMTQDRGKLQFVKRLKHAQNLLGGYEELAEFRKLGRKLDLKALPLIERDWLRARKRARSLPAHLDWIVEGLTNRRAEANTTPQKVSA